MSNSKVTCLSYISTGIMCDKRKTRSLHVRLSITLTCWPLSEFCCNETYACLKWMCMTILKYRTATFRLMAFKWRVNCFVYFFWVWILHFFDIISLMATSNIMAFRIQNNIYSLWRQYLCFFVKDTNNTNWNRKRCWYTCVCITTRQYGFRI